MLLLSYWSLLVCLLLSLAAGGGACWQAFSGRDDATPWFERAHLAVTALMVLCSAVLIRALATRDYSFVYVAEYTSNTLPQFYALTAFWAGQAGSLLFWALCVAVMGAMFPFTAGYHALRPPTRTLYWAFFFAVQAFFLLAMTNWSNPFTELTPPPPDGRGLNPLLQNPGMIFHPPLLFLGYAGFTVPACLALSAILSGEPVSWLRLSRNWNITAWIFLTAGIVLGGWWSYMELGWGGYWAWDPVENASLIPWLSATAFLHTGVIEDRRGALRRTNVVLMSVTLLLCFFATYLVRSGVIDSLHAFGDGGVGGPLLTFILVGLAATGLAAFLGDAGESRPLGGLLSRPGFLVMSAWLLLAVGLVIMLGTMWPVISKLWSQKPQGLDQGFYNRVCLPLFAALGALLVICPWLGWKEGFRHLKGLTAVGGALIGGGALLAAMGVTLPVALLAAASAVAILVGISVLFALDRGVRGRRTAWGAYGVHAGLALVFLGVAFSGPYVQHHEVVMKPGAPTKLSGYDFVLQGLEERRSPAMALLEAKISVTKDGKSIGELTPQRRIYRGFEQPFAEVSTIPSLGDELYATLLGASADDTASVKISVHPLVNWVWIGGTLMCLAGFLALGGRPGLKAAAEESDAA